MNAATGFTPSDSLDAMRYTDGDGVRWRIVEQDAERVPGARGPRCLIFFSDSIVRRLWHYPSDWRSIAPELLLALTLGLEPR